LLTQAQAWNGNFLLRSTAGAAGGCQPPSLCSTLPIPSRSTGHTGANREIPATTGAVAYSSSNTGSGDTCRCGSTRFHPARLYASSSTRRFLNRLVLLALSYTDRHAHNNAHKYERYDSYDRQPLGCAIPWCIFRFGDVLWVAVGRSSWIFLD